jgi:vitamin K-dependent gamma-carboxylase
MGSRLQRWIDYLSAPVDAASLGVFRIVLGAMIAWDAVRFWQFGWIDEYYILPKWHFTYLYFDWVRPWPGIGMYVHFAALFVCAVLVALGLYFRPAIVLLFLAYTYVFLLEKSVYMNHYYLIALLCFLLIWMQPQRAFALDRRRHPELPSTVPRWNVLLLRVQLFIVYFYGAIAKLNPDWLAGEPMYSEIARRAPDVPQIASHVPPALLAYSIAYGGILFDATVPVLLCFRRTRRIGFVAAALFHLLNDLFLQIGVFSYLMTGAITIFFDPDWPRQLWRRWRALPAVPPRPPAPAPPRRWVGLALLHLYVLAQLFIPLRHWLYPGTVGWTEDGHRFSWHMKLRLKAGAMTITATDPATGRRWTIDPADDLRERQLQKLHTFPDILLQYVHYKRDELRAQGIRDPVITVDWHCSLNGAPPQPLIDPTINLAAEQASIWPARWIVRDRK